MWSMENAAETLIVTAFSLTLDTTLSMLLPAKLASVFAGARHCPPQLSSGAQRTRHYTVISAGVESSRLSAPLGLERLATQSPSQLSPCGALDYEHGNLVRRPPVSGRERSRALKASPY